MWLKIWGDYLMAACIRQELFQRSKNICGYMRDFSADEQAATMPFALGAGCRMAALIQLGRMAIAGAPSSFSRQN